MVVERSRTMSKQNEAHCESCGRTNPTTDDGYTTCCNELVCCGEGKEKFEHEETGEFVYACCWAKGDIKWMEKYNHCPPNGSYRA